MNDLTVSRLGPATKPSPVPRCTFVSDDDGVLLDPLIGKGRTPDLSAVLDMAGPREKIFFEPSSSRAAIITCGGLCPGLNDVIRGLTMVLWYRYGVRDILGIRYGYSGLVASGDAPVKLTPDLVEDIHQDGGTMLGSSRGHQDAGAMVDFMEENKINILFTIGGDGTQRGALALTEEITRRNLSISIIGIPKTIDNDIRMTDRTFGFETAVAMSQVPIACAHNEAKGAKRGIGLVKLMGRDSGFVAAYASLASSDVNLVLVPEVPFTLDEVFSFIDQRLKNKSHAVIVAAEGAGQDILAATGNDASGNKKLADIGVFLKDKITEHFKSKGEPVSIKYIDPSYTIRSAPASADDSVFCFQLSEHAVHAAMTGRTGAIVSTLNGCFVYVPMKKSVGGRKYIDPKGSLWTSVLQNTGQ